MAAVAHDESLAEDEILRRALELKKAVLFDACISKTAYGKKLA